MKDWILFTIVAVIVAVDIVFLVIVSVDVWRLRLTAQLVPRKVRKYSKAITMNVQDHVRERFIAYRSRGITHKADKIG